MPVNTEPRIYLDRSRLISIRQSLKDFFATDFEIWVYDQQWLRLVGDELDGFDAAPESEVELLESTRTFPTAPACIAHEGGRLATLAIPLPRLQRRTLVATAQFPHVDPENMRRQAQLFLKQLETQNELAELRQEHDAFLRQVTNDFEELTFLRSMASLLEISDLSFDFVAMGESMLPTLKPLVDCDALVLVGAANFPGLDGESPNGMTPCVWSGTRCVSEEACVRLVEQYREAVASQPIVKNYFDQTPEGANFPGIHSFIMVPIVTSDLTIGWLIALNRNNERNLNVGEMPWELSYLEFGTHEATLMSSSAAILATHARNVQLFRERESLLVHVVRSLVSAVEAKDEYTRGHSERVALYAKRIAQQMGCDEDYCEKLYLSGLLHDIGKIGVRDAVLRKTGPLTDEEFEEVKQHPDKGWQILRDLQMLGYVLNGILHHHEQYDGRGYPDKLKGDEIPLDGRILAVADAYDAMTSDRPYREGMPQEKAEAILRKGSGQQWDPQIIDAFFSCIDDILHIKATYRQRATPQRKEVAAAL